MDGALVLDDVTQQDRDAFDSWRSAHPDNAYAWQQLEELQRKFTGIPNSPISRKVLAPKQRGLNRRQVLMLGTFSWHVKFDDVYSYLSSQWCGVHYSDG